MLSTVVILLRAHPASAHVKWFCSYDVAAPPQPVHLVLNNDFGHLVLLTLAILLLAGLLDRTPLGFALLRSLDRVTGFLRCKTDVLIRAALGGFSWPSGQPAGSS